MSVVAETTKNVFADITKLIMHWTRCTEKQKYDEKYYSTWYIVLLANCLSFSFHSHILNITSAVTC
jgi:hypothetical protein